MTDHRDRLGDKQHPVEGRLEALQALKDHLDPDTRSLLRRVAWDADDNPGLRQAVIRALVYELSDEALEFAEEMWSKGQVAERFTVPPYVDGPEPDLALWTVRIAPLQALSTIAFHRPDRALDMFDRVSELLERVPPVVDRQCGLSALKWLSTASGSTFRLEGTPDEVRSWRAALEATIARRTAGRDG